MLLCEGKISFIDRNLINDGKNPKNTYMFKIWTLVGTSLAVVLLSVLIMAVFLNNLSQPSLQNGKEFDKQPAQGVSMVSVLLGYTAGGDYKECKRNKIGKRMGRQACGETDRPVDRKGVQIMLCKLVIPEDVSLSLSIQHDMCSGVFIKVYPKIFTKCPFDHLKNERHSTYVIKLIKLFNGQ